MPSKKFLLCWRQISISIRDNWHCHANFFFTWQLAAYGHRLPWLKSPLWFWMALVTVPGLELTLCLAYWLTAHFTGGNLQAMWWRWRVASKCTSTPDFIKCCTFLKVMWPRRWCHLRSSFSAGDKLVFPSEKGVQCGQVVGNCAHFMCGTWLETHYLHPLWGICKPHTNTRFLPSPPCSKHWHQYSNHTHWDDWGT